MELILTFVFFIIAYGFALYIAKKGMIMKNKPTGDLLTAVKAAQDVAFFVKYNEYPEIGGSGFHELAVLLNKLEVELKKIGMGINKET